MNSDWHEWSNQMFREELEECARRAQEDDDDDDERHATRKQEDEEADSGLDGALLQAHGAFAHAQTKPRTWWRVLGGAILFILSAIWLLLRSWRLILIIAIVYWYWQIDREATENAQARAHSLRAPAASAQTHRTGH